MKSFLARTSASMVNRFFGGAVDGAQFRRLVRMLWQQRSKLLVAIACMAAYNIFNAMPAWYAKDVVDALESGEAMEIDRFVIVGVGIFLIFALKGFFFFAHQYLIRLCGQRLIYHLRMRLYNHLHSLSFSFFASRPSGDLITRFTSDLLTLEKSVRVSMLGPLRDVPMIMIFLGILLYRSWQLFGVSLVVIPIALVLIGQYGRRTKRLTGQRLVTFGEMTSLLMETIRGIRVVKAFNMERYEQERFERANQDLLRKYMRTERITSYSEPVLETIGALAGTVIIIFGGYLILHGIITAGDFVSFLLAFFMLNQPVRRLNMFNIRVQEGLAAAGRVFELLDVAPQEVDKPDAATLPPFSREIRLEVGGFRYAGKEEKALQEVELTVQRGQVVALVGPSGAGKTTLVNLIPRFFELEEGRILIDGHDIREVTYASLRRQIAIVTQEIYLFNDTVANNIAYGNIDCPREEIERVAKDAYAHDFIMALPEGYDTEIGEGGIQLSGGQRQRLSIARALIKNAPILILDEATSALDSESEQAVQKAIERVIENRTTFVIAHRLSTIQRADMICVMDKGRIVETGTHQTLLRRGGLYTKLHDMQFRDSTAAPPAGSQALRRLWTGMRRAAPGRVERGA